MRGAARPARDPRRAAPMARSHAIGYERGVAARDACSTARWRTSAQGCSRVAAAHVGLTGPCRPRSLYGHEVAARCPLGYERALREGCPRSRHAVLRRGRGQGLGPLDAPIVAPAPEQHARARPTTSGRSQSTPTPAPRTATNPKRLGRVTRSSPSPSLGCLDVPVLGGALVSSCPGAPGKPR